MTRSNSITRALALAIKDAPLLPRDVAGVALAKRYAAILDANPDLSGDLGPKFLAVLNALGMTPTGRAAKTNAKGGEGDVAVAGAAALDELRARRATRADRAANLDAAAPAVDA